MTETLFEISAFNKPLYRDGPSAPDAYQNLLQQYSLSFYGLYTESFIKRIAIDAEKQYRHMGALYLKKSLRKCVKKFLLTDLELIFLAYFCGVRQWDIHGCESDLGSRDKMSAD